MPPIASDLYPWLTNTFCENILHSSDGIVNAKIIDFELEDAVGKGENYGSQMMRVFVNYYSDSDTSEPKQKSYIVKSDLCNASQEIIDIMPTGSREFAFYQYILPNIMKFTKSVDESFKFAPSCYHLRESPLYFVLEDLKPIGYRNMDRRKGLDFRATEMVLTKLARYHAMGAHLYVTNSSNIFDAHKMKVIKPDDYQLIEMFMCGMKDLPELSRNWPGYEHLPQKFEKLNRNYIDKVHRVFETDDSGFNVITHGDLWVNNIMYKFDEDDKPIDVLTVDFQMGFVGSPAIDLAYILYTSTANDIDEKDWDRLLQIYHAELVRTLQLINYPNHIPTLTELQIQMLKRSAYAVMIALTMIAPRNMENTEHADLELFVFDNIKSKALRYELYEKPATKERIMYLLDYFERKGFLEAD